MVARRAFTIPEVLVVVAVIAVLGGVLLVALAGVRGTGEMTQSLSRMRQIGLWVREYATDNRDTVLPSEFDYAGNPNPGKVRSSPDVPQGEPHEGTWADILWTVNALGPIGEDTKSEGIDVDGVYNYPFDSPDETYYRGSGADWTGNPLRAVAPNSRDTPQGNIAEPFGEGARESGLPGFFAANNFFDASEGQWWSMGQIRFPDRAMYLVDSFAGETIDPSPGPFAAAVDWSPASGMPPPQVDFRYNNQCLMLFLDGHTTPQDRWLDIVELEGCTPGGNAPPEPGRGIRIRDLHKKSPPPC
jgi:prepilin-type N-terminal cleavage/methylation domain-containing protein